MRQLALHPSPSMVLPSSQVSQAPVLISPFPHIRKSKENRIVSSLVWLLHTHHASASQYLISADEVFTFLAHGYCGSCHQLSEFWVTIIQGVWVYVGENDILVQLLFEIPSSHNWSHVIVNSSGSIATHHSVSLGVDVLHLSIFGDHQFGGFPF